MEVNSFQSVLIECYIMALTCLKGRTECGNIWVKNPIYSAPAVKGLSDWSVLLSDQWSLLSHTGTYGPQYTQQTRDVHPMLWARGADGGPTL